MDRPPSKSRNLAAEHQNMTHRMHPTASFTYRKNRREKMLRKMCNMRAAKEIKRMENPVEREPVMQRYYPLEIGVRDKRTGECAWTEFRSVRDAARRLTIVQKYYE
jgi:hypothetical protein